MKQVDRQDDEEQFKSHDVRGECFAPHLALMLKSEWHKLNPRVGGYFTECARSEAAVCHGAVAVADQPADRPAVTPPLTWCEALSFSFGC